jgi:peptidoglycan/xylan/chitin deacetylase (PgdA/CDA1 family)
MGVTFSFWTEVLRAYFSGLLSADKRRHCITVFCYHGILERKTDSSLERNFHLLSDFKSHVRFLSRYRVLSLPELVEEISSSTKSRGPAAVITFDDGYANNLLAGEVLSAAGLPWTVFVATGAVGRENSIWAIELSLLLLYGRAERIEALDRVCSLKSDEERKATFQKLRQPLKLMPSAQRQSVMDCIRQQFPLGETERLLRIFPSMQMLSWEEVEQLANAGVEVGSHGVNHEIHHGAQPASLRCRELVDSKLELERRLKRPCNFFAFPNGIFSPTSADEVCDAGFQLAFTSLAGTVRAGLNPYLLPRLTPRSTLRQFSRNLFWEPRSASDEI